jgi:hypothetical protein
MPATSIGQTAVSTIDSPGKGSVAPFVPIAMIGITDEPLRIEFQVWN